MKRWVQAPPPTSHNHPSLLGTWVEDEENSEESTLVDWVWTHDTNGSYVSGYEEKKVKTKEIPVIPPLPRDWDPFPDPNPIVAICGECGLQLYRVMSYCCGNPRCPCGLGGVTC